MINSNKFLSSNFSKFLKENNEALKKIFSGKIKQSFLIKVLSYIQKEIKYYGEIIKYYRFDFSVETIMKGDTTTIDYDICRHIVGCHRENMIFVPESERAALQNNQQYIDELARAVVNDISLRAYGDVYFRKQPLTAGDELIYFPTMYHLFVVSIRGSQILQNEKYFSPVKPLFSEIFNKALSSMILIEAGFLDAAYNSCRSAIDNYINLLVLLKNPTSIEGFSKFLQYDILKENCGKGYTDEFIEVFENRKNKIENIMIKFLQYGWVDSIDKYHILVKNRPYSFGGLMIYLKSISDDKAREEFDFLENNHKKCHAYSHGTTIHSRYPLLNYFELSLMLSVTLIHTYKLLCKDANEDTDINGIDILAILDKEYKILRNKFENRSTQKFEEYYSQFQ